MSSEGLIAILILFGAGLMGFSLARTAGIIRRLPGARYLRRWRLLFLLMAFFLAGYLSASLLVLSGRVDLLALLSGVIFLFGALFVFLVVETNLRTIDDLLATTVSKAYVQEILQTMAEPLVVAGADLEVELANPAALSLLGYTEGGLVGQPLQSIFNDEDAFHRICDSLKHGAVRDVELFYRTRDRQGIPVSFSGASMRARGGQPGGVVCVAQDITVRKQFEAGLLHKALYDALTNVPNRVLLMERLNQAIQRARRDQRYALLFLDLDGFKAVNDSLGHPMGDRLLCAVARRLEGCIRSSDTIARLGGDEFILLLQDIDQPEGVVQAAERILEMFRSPFFIEGQRLYSSASIGIVTSGGGSDCATAEAALKAADLALYQAKAGGKGRYVLYTGCPPV